MRNRMLGMAAAALVLAPLTASAQNAPQPAARARVAAEAARLAAGDLPGPIDSPSDLLDTAKMAFLLADTNNDHLISQKEAIDAGNLLVGGFFFRADQDGDGTLTREEAQQAREALFQQRPLLRFMLQRANRDNAPEGGEAAAPAASPRQASNAIARLLDANSDQKLQATELRQAVQTGVESVYSVADKNRDGQMSPAELNAAMYGAARAAITAAFRRADQDNNGALSKQEFAQSLTQPAYTVFDILDRDLDGQLTPQELAQASRMAVHQIEMLRVPEPANSPANVIGSRAAAPAPAPAPAPTPAPAPANAPAATPAPATVPAPPR